MNNREWLNKMTDEKYAEEISSLTNKFLNENTKLLFSDYVAEWLSQPHETTADEDFAEIGYRKQPEKYSDEVRYTNDEFEVVVLKKETRLRIFPSMEVVNVSLEENKIRKIADKKRKELGW